MGSLMAGWDSPILMDPETAKLERNRSLTKEEIDGFWKGHKKLQIEECEDPNGEEPKKSPVSPLSPFFNRSPRNAREWKDGVKELKDGEKSKKNGDWWMRSSWAFLNEPPVDGSMESVRKYAAQFDVADMASSTSV